MAKLFENISNLIDGQVPSFVNDNHQKFVTFLKKYYEWLEDSEQGAVLYYNKKLIDAFDLDKTSLLDQFQKGSLFGPTGLTGSEGTSSAVTTGTGTETGTLDETKKIKQAQKLLSGKSGIDAYKLLFRILFNVDVDVYYPKEDILKASSGKWTLPQAIRVTASDELYAIDTGLLIKKRLYGEISNNHCVVENVYKTIERDSGIQILEIFISNLDRSFIPGEYAIIDYTDADGKPARIRQKIIGSISNLKIDPNRRGTKYRGLEIDPDTNAITYPGDPVSFYNGLSNSPTAIKAEAYVKNVTSGGIQSIDLIDAGMGYRTFTNTFVTVMTPTEGHGANIYVRVVDSDNTINVVVNTDSIELKGDTELQASNYFFENTGSATISTVLGTAFAFANVEVAPLKLVDVKQSGMGYKTSPRIQFETFYSSDIYLDEDIMFEIDVTPMVGPNTQSLYLSSSPVSYYEGSYVLIVQKNSRATREMRKIVQAIPQDDGSVLLVVDNPFSDLINENVKVFVDNRPRMKDLGQIANVRIISSGTGYAIDDKILFNSSTSIGYGANAHVSAITGVGGISEITVTERGEGYREAPMVGVQSTGGSGAILIAGILSNNEIANTIVEGNGEIKDFRIVQRGFDYIATPNVSLKIKDIYVYPEDTIDKIIVPGERIWQNTGTTTDFTGLVDFYDETNAMLRIYNYAGTLNVRTSFTTANLIPSSNVTFNVSQYPNGTYKLVTYGDGRAKANASFLNGLIQYDGYYLNTDGFLSADKRLQGPRKYQTYSYVLASDIGMDKYKNSVDSLLHSSGGIMFGQYNLNTNLDITAKQITLNIAKISPLTGSIDADGTSTVIDGVDTSFTTTANANDIIVIDVGNTYREQSKYIVDVISDTSLELESNLSFVGYGRANSKPDSNIMTIYSTTIALSSFLSVGDEIKVNVANTSNSANSMVVTKTIETINDVTKRITLDSDFVGVNSNGRVYIVSPNYNSVNYKIIPGI